MLKTVMFELLPTAAQQSIKRIHYARKLRSTSTEDERDLEIVRFLVEKGDRAIDIGANFGLYTKALSNLVGPTGSVISVEPIPQTFDILRWNVRKLGLRNVQLVNYALSDTHKTVQMEVPRYSTGGENFYQARIIEGDGTKGHRKFKIHSTTMDSLFLGLDDVGFVKCDVEGHEWACLVGGERFLKSFQPAWLIEVSGAPERPGSSAEKVFNAMTQHHYKPFWYDGSRLRHRRKGDSSVNYFFLTQRHIAKLTNIGVLAKENTQRR